MSDAAFARERRKLWWAWMALLALMFMSLGSAYLSLGIGNLIAGLVIATLKSAIVVVVFMRLARGTPMLRIVGATALATWALLAGLSSVDYATRPHEPAHVQPPQQVPAFNGAEDRP